MKALSTRMSDLPTSLRFMQLSCAFPALGQFPHAVGDENVEHIAVEVVVLNLLTQDADGTVEAARLKGNMIAQHATRVAGAAAALVMVAGNARHHFVSARPRNLVQELQGVRHVTLDVAALDFAALDFI